MYKPALEIAKLDTWTCVLQHFSHSSVISQERRAWQNCLIPTYKFPSIWSQTPQPPVTHPAVFESGVLQSNSGMITKAKNTDFIGWHHLAVYLFICCQHVKCTGSPCRMEILSFWSRSWTAVTVPCNFERDTYVTLRETLKCKGKTVYLNLPVINWRTEQNSPDGISGFHLFNFFFLELDSLLSLNQGVW